MSKKPDYSGTNIPVLKKFCKDNGLSFDWKNEAQGHAVVSSDAVELYVWVQRMAIQVRKQRGNLISKPFMFNGSQTFNAKQFKELSVQQFKQKKVKNPVFRKGVVITIIKAGTPDNIKNELLRQARLLAKQHSSVKA